MGLADSGVSSELSVQMSVNEYNTTGLKRPMLCFVEVSVGASYPNAR